MIFIGRIGARGRKLKKGRAPTDERPWFIALPLGIVSMIQGKAVEIEDFPLVYDDIPLWVKRPHANFKEGDVVEIDMSVNPM